MIQTPPGSNPGQLTGTLFDATSGDPGTYTFQFTLQNQPPPGCVLDYQVSVDVDQAVSAGMGAATLVYCYNTNQLVPLALSLFGEDPNGVWTETSSVPSQGNAFNPVNGTFAVLGQAPGYYSFQYKVTSGGACPEDTSEVKVNIITLPVVTIAAPTALSCANPEVILNAGGSSFGSHICKSMDRPRNYYQWQVRIPCSPTVDKAGQYILTISNSLNGCTNADTVNVTGTTDAPSSAVVDVRTPTCYGVADAFIHVDQVNGGVAPYQYSLNNGTPTNSPKF
jgi:hypothetical protein